MRNYFLPIFLIIFGINFAYAADNNSPVGYWKTVDDVTGKVRSIIHITENNNTLSGTIIKIYPQAGESEKDICKVCTDYRHNQRIVGMTILTGLKADNSEWKDGEILDPKNGKVYRCTVRLQDNGDKLNVHGYIGISVFGRSQIWLRTGKAS